MSADERDPYRILHVDPEADQDVIAAAYRVLARKLHPDASGATDPGISRRMADLSWAWSLLRDPVRRQTFDRDRRFTGRRPAAGRAATPSVGEPRDHGVPRPDVDHDPGTVRIEFGRYAGSTLREILKRDPAYLEWLRRHSSGAPHRDGIAQLLRERSARSR